MLRTNLSTRPFYNERAVHFVLGLLGLIAIAVLVIEAYRLVSFSSIYTSMTDAAERDETEVAEVATQVTAIQSEINNDQLEALSAAAHEAKQLIDQRVFSWTEFFNRIERTLPENVMLTSVRPDIEPSLINVSMEVMGRDVAHIDDFIKQLEETGAFAELLAREEEITEQGMYRARLRGRYFPVSDAARNEGDTANALTPANELRPPANPVETQMSAPNSMSPEFQ